MVLRRGDSPVLHKIVTHQGTIIISIIFYLPKKEAGYQKSRSSSYAGRPLYTHRWFIITIINMRIKHTTHISTYKHSKQVYHSTHYTLTYTQTQNNHLKWRPRSTLLVTVLLTVNSYKELITFTWYVQDYCSVILPADCKNIFTLSAKVLGQ